jgi:hypothetical protein
MASDGYIDMAPSNSSTMAHYEAATKAPLALTLPTSLVLTYLDRKGPLFSSTLQKTYLQDAKLGDGSSVRLTFRGQVLTDGDIVDYLTASPRHEDYLVGLRLFSASLYFLLPADHV